MCSIMWNAEQWGDANLRNVSMQRHRPTVLGKGRSQLIRILLGIREHNRTASTAMGLDHVCHDGAALRPMAWQHKMLDAS